ncbi:MAG: gluconate 2-dehydrogenase subunit 3 family protein, partial [Saprospiraceae bacterium]|nr:gluconate 2-dehydrogenase subunit 3 family protein [Saprospiraceae bacterium]
KNISILTGAAVVGGEFFLSGCNRNDNVSEMIGLFSKKEITFFDEIAEAIIPRTSTPGAKDAQVGNFIADFVSNCYDAKDQNIIKNSLATIDQASQTQYKKAFVKITPEQRHELLQKAALEAKAYNENPQKAADAPPHYYTLFQQLTLMGFFTSEPGYTQVLRYEIVPGKYEACIDYKEETAWANW